MSYGTSALIKTYFLHRCFKTKADVEEYLESQNDRLKQAKKRLEALAYMTEPQKFCESSDPLYWLDEQIQQWAEELYDAAIERYKANCLLAGWDAMHHENGCVLYEPASLDSLQRMSADDIPECNADGSNAHPDNEYETLLYEKQIKEYERTCSLQNRKNQEHQDPNRISE